MSEQELNLVQLSAGKVAQSGASAPQIMRSQFRYVRACGSRFHNLPKHLGCHTSSPNSSPLVNRSEERTVDDSARLHPFLNGSLHPSRYGNRSGVTSLAPQVSDNPALLA